MEFQYNYPMKISSKVVSDRFEDEAVLVNLESGIYCSLKATAMDIWEKLQQGYQVDELPKLFQSLSDVQQKEIDSFIQFLIAENLLIPSDEKLPQAKPIESALLFSGLEYSKYDDMADLIMIDPIHEADDQKGWPNKPE